MTGFDGQGAYHPVTDRPRPQETTVSEMHAYLNGWHAGYAEGRKDGEIFGALK